MIPSLSWAAARNWISAVLGAWHGFCEINKLVTDRSSHLHDDSSITQQYGEFLSILRQIFDVVSW